MIKLGQNSAVEFRAYKDSEFDFACNLRGITEDLARAEYRERFESVGQWRDHYLDYVIDVDGEPIGQVQLRHCDKTMPPGVLEFGIELAPEFQGKGFGTDAIKKITEFMFSQDYHRISGSTDVSNIGMQRAFEKAGWTFEGTMFSLFVEDGVAHDYLSYSCINSKS